MTLIEQGPDLEHKRRAHQPKAGALATNWTPALLVGQVRYKGCHRLYSPSCLEGVSAKTPLNGTRRKLGLFGAPVQGRKAYPDA